MRKKQPPLALRLFRFDDGRGEVYRVSSTLDEGQRTTQQARAAYRGRWGIELQFRSPKQTFGRSKLRSRTPEHAGVERHGSLMGLVVLRLLALEEQTQLITRAGEEHPAALRQLEDGTIAA
jgi:IS4 transposase